jgi:hypothetical protein
MVSRWVRFLFVWVFLSALFFGCAGAAKETKVKCPKCGAVFTIDEGIAEEQRSGRGGM